MRTSTRSLFLLASALSFAPGCDEPDDLAFEGDGFADDEEVTPRCIGPSCTLGGLGNTSKLGDHALSNLSKVIGKDADNNTAMVRITGGTGYYFGTPYPILQIAVDADGELRLQLTPRLWISGTMVEYARFNLVVTPKDPKQQPFDGVLVIRDAKCEPGKYDPGMTICSYEFLTNVVPDDVTQYPMDEKMFGYYHTCPNEDEGGLLPATMKFHSVLSPQVTLFESGTPRIDPNPGFFINGCINGAVSKTQYWLNAFYDASSFRGLDASQRTAALLMWMAWFDGAPRTEPGMKISPHDPIKGLFTWTADPAWDVEAGYGAGGAVCRGGDLVTGLHRLIDDPMSNLPGWDQLPYCDAAHLANLAPLGVKVELPPF